MSQVQAERIQIFSSWYLSFSHLHVPLLSVQFSSLKTESKLGWCRQISMQGNILDVQYHRVFLMRLLWSKSLTGLGHVHLTTNTSIRLTLTEFPVSHCQHKGWQIEQEPSGLPSATSLHPGKNTPIQRPQQPINPGKPVQTLWLHLKLELILYGRWCWLVTHQG